MSRKLKFVQHMARIQLSFEKSTVFFYPASFWSLPLLNVNNHQQYYFKSQYSTVNTNVSTPPPPQNTPEFEKWALNKLPRQCPGCGAPSQTIDSHEPGYYDLKRHAVKKFLGLARHTKKKEHNEIVRAALERAASLSEDLDLECLKLPDKTHKVEIVKCFRCRNIQNHNFAQPLNHPSFEAIRAMLDESSFKYNHIYHVIDAADFPMSVITDLHNILRASPLRSKNRRSKTGKFYSDRITEISFIITRSDLLAPLKEQVDTLMPYFQLVLRDALGKVATGMRLGNIHCVSVKRCWWTKELKEEVWNRGNAGWLIGKVNVGKSQLFNGIYPKGRTTAPEPEKEPSNSPSIFLEDIKNNEIWDTNLKRTDTSDLHGNITTETVQKSDDMVNRTAENHSSTEIRSENTEIDEIEEENFDTESLLLPPPAEVDYPTLPITSQHPGTTVSPIRLLYGNNKGELIDLPGLDRGDLKKYVEPAHRHQLFMDSRVQPEQQVILPGQSLLLGGFIRITPNSPDTVILAYPFTPMHPHLTNTLKAIGTQAQTRESAVMNISTRDTPSKIASAGKFLLKWDVTKKRTGSLTAYDAGRVHVDQLPFRVIGTDILIEGCGWVELVAQVSKRHGSSIINPLDPSSEARNTPEVVENQETGEIWPSVEVFTPEGKYVTDRRPMNAWTFLKKKKLKARPRMAVSGQRERMTPIRSDGYYQNYYPSSKRLES